MIRKDLPVPETLPLSVRLTAAANFLRLSTSDLAELLGVQEADIPGLLGGADCAAPAAAKAEQVVALFKTLNRFLGKEEMAARWLHASSQAFNCKPIDMLFRPGGALQLIDYLKTLHRQL